MSRRSTWPAPFGPARGRRALLLGAAGLVAATGLPAGAQQAAQPRLPTERLVIRGRDGREHVFDVEMALTPEQQTVGLMFRPEVKPGEGMLFDWGMPPRESTMWMRNTVASLDMVFITAGGRIHRIAERTVPFSLDTIASRGPVRATLELAAGTAERLGLHVGDAVAQRIFGNA